MNDSLRKILNILWARKCVGGKHAPEDRIIVPKIKWMNKNEQKQFMKEYQYFVDNAFVLRFKKRTGKGTDWHISLNPEKIDELLSSLGIENEKR